MSRPSVPRDLPALPLPIRLDGIDLYLAELAPAEALRLMEVLCRNRLSRPARHALVEGVAKLFSRAPHGAIARERLLHWSRVVAEAAGEPAWHAEEVQWMRTLSARFALP